MFGIEKYLPSKSWGKNKEVIINDKAKDSKEKVPEKTTESSGLSNEENKQDSEEVKN